MATLDYRSPQTPDKSGTPGKPKRSFGRMLLAQWPFFLGLGSIGLGLLVIRTVFHSAARGGGRLGLYLIAFGVAMILYWAFSSEKKGDYNF